MNVHIVIYNNFDQNVSTLKKSKTNFANCFIPFQVKFSEELTLKFEKVNLNDLTRNPSPWMGSCLADKRSPLYS